MPELSEQKDQKKELTLQHVLNPRVKAQILASDKKDHAVNFIFDKLIAPKYKQIKPEGLEQAKNAWIKRYTGETKVGEDRIDIKPDSEGQNSTATLFSGINESMGNMAHWVDKLNPNTSVQKGDQRIEPFFRENQEALDKEFGGKQYEENNPIKGGVARLAGQTAPAIASGALGEGVLAKAGVSGLPSTIAKAGLNAMPFAGNKKELAGFAGTDLALHGAGKIGQAMMKSPAVKLVQEKITTWMKAGKKPTEAMIQTAKEEIKEKVETATEQVLRKKAEALHSVGKEEFEKNNQINQIIQDAMKQIPNSELASGAVKEKPVLGDIDKVDKLSKQVGRGKKTDNEKLVGQIMKKPTMADQMKAKADTKKLKTSELKKKLDEMAAGRGQ